MFIPVNVEYNRNNLITIFLLNLFILDNSIKIGKKIVKTSKGIIYSKLKKEKIKNSMPKK